MRLLPKIAIIYVRKTRIYCSKHNNLCYISNKIMMNRKIWVEQWYFCEVSKSSNALLHNNLRRKIHGKVLKRNALCHKIQFFCPSNYKHYITIMSVHNNLCLKVQHWKIIVKHSGQQKHRQTQVTPLQYNWFKFSSLQTLASKKIKRVNILGMLFAILHITFPSYSPIKPYPRW